MLKTSVFGCSEIFYIFTYLESIVLPNLLDCTHCSLKLYPTICLVGDESTIETVRTSGVIIYFRSKHLLRLCKLTHTFQMQTQARVDRAKKRESATGECCEL